MEGTPILQVHGFDEVRVCQFGDAFLDLWLRPELDARAVGFGRKAAFIQVCKPAKFFQLLLRKRQLIEQFGTKSLVL